MRFTNINPALCWVVGWAHLVQALVLILTGGAVTTGLPYRATIWAARKHNQQEGR